MASGFSWSGGQPRCFAYWQEFQKCYAKSEVAAECKLQAGDYVECLHHGKEMAKTMKIQDEYERKLQKALKDRKEASDRVVDNTIVGVGLIKAEAEKQSSK